MVSRSDYLNQNNKIKHFFGVIISITCCYLVIKLNLFCKKLLRLTVRDFHTGGVAPLTPGAVV